MKKVFAAAIFTLAMSAVTSCDSFGGPSKSELKTTVDSLNTILSTKDAELDEFMEIFNKVSEGFNQISIAENRVELQRDAVEGGAKSAKEKIVSDLSYIQKRMNENRDLIAELQEKLKKSDSNSTQLKKALQSLQNELQAKEKQIVTLQSELAAKNIYIQELDSAVNSLSAERASLIADNEKKSQTLSQQEETLNAAWYVVANKKELKEMKVLTNTGLFKKGDVMEDPEVDKSAFIQIDIRNIKEISLNADDCKILTIHPESSYTLSKDKESGMILQINNPESFWNITRYLVVQIK